MTAVAKMLNLIADTPGGAAVARAVEFMQIAETEVDAGMAEHGKNDEARGRIWSAFGVLYPRHLIDFGDDLYRAHCRELVARAARGEETRSGTKAEVLATISRMTLASRLQHDVELLALRLSDELLGTTLADGSPSYEGALDEILTTMRRRLAVATRDVAAHRRPAPKKPSIHDRPTEGE